MDTELSLSTAAPSVAGKPPELFGKLVSYRTPASSYSAPAPMSNRMVQKAMNNPTPQRNFAPMSQQAVWAPMMNSAPGEADDDDIPPSVPVAAMQATSSKTMTSFVFNIPRKANIESDKKPHKVSIQKILLKTSYSYTILPISAKAYLKASVTNTTTFPFLSGPMNVFMDNNFVAKSHLDLVNPSESLGIHLGIDNNIKVEHQELKNFKETVGLISKSHKQTINLNTIIKSSKDKDIIVSVFHQLPRSTQGDIKVVLKEPQIEEGPNAKIVLTAANNVHRTATIPAGKRVDFAFNYYVEFPAEKDIDFI